MTEIIQPAELTVEADRVIMRGPLASSALYADLCDDTEAETQFNEQFEFVKGKCKDGFIAEEDYYQGVNIMIVIRRKADGRLFGYQVWSPISKHGEMYEESNGSDHGFEWEDQQQYDDDLQSVYVWLPVEPFSIPGYRFPKAAEVSA